MPRLTDWIIFPTQLDAEPVILESGEMTVTPM